VLSYPPLSCRCPASVQQNCSSLSTSPSRSISPELGRTFRIILWSGLSTTVSPPSGLLERSLTKRYTDSNSSIFTASNLTGANLRAAHDLYYTNRTGPWTAPLISTLAFPPLHLLTPNSTSLLSQATAFPAAHYLSDETRQHPTVVAGYTVQRQIQLSLLARPDTAASEILADSIGTLSTSAMRPLSRGTVRALHSDIFPPSSSTIAIDPRYCSHPVDCALLVAALKFNARLVSTPEMRSLEPRPAWPWVGTTPDETPEEEEARLLDAVGENLRTEFHACGTTAMMPLSLGGVVDPSLKVYGMDNLRVVDAGVMPLIPGAHLQAAVYAVAEKVSFFPPGCTVRMKSGS
jgi:choline dehydrogenase